MNCSVLTRDIGTNYSYSKCIDAVATAKPKTKDSQVMTDLCLLRDEKLHTSKYNFDQLFTAVTKPKPKLSTIGTQTLSKINSLEIIEKRDTGVQTQEEVAAPATISLKNLTAASNDYTPKSIFDRSYKRNRSVATSTHDLPHTNHVNNLRQELLNHF